MHDIPKLQSLCRLLNISDQYQRLLDDEWKSIEQSHQKYQASDAVIWIREDSWDSSQLGKTVGKVEQLTGENKKDILRVLSDVVQSQKFQYILFRLNSSHLSWVQLIEESGGILLDASIELICTNVSAIQHHGTLTVKPYAESYREQVKSCAGSFSHGRFFSDPLFRKGQTIYQSWIENALDNAAADQTFIAVDHGELHGFVSIKSVKVGSKNLLHIPLIAKKLNSSRPGVGKILLSSVLEYASEHQFDGVTLGTQISNLPALRAYTQMGFFPYASEYTCRLIAV
jgi:dTDP-4-amino-4,6-dideoxy-D-galactose acyltransferase